MKESGKTPRPRAASPRPRAASAGKAGVSARRSGTVAAPRSTTRAQPAAASAPGRTTARTARVPDLRALWVVFYALLGVDLVLLFVVLLR
jgi:hypothetical protein